MPQIEARSTFALRPQDPALRTPSPIGTSIWGTGTLVSSLYPWKNASLQPALDAGRMENIFWFDPQEVHNGSRATWGEFPDGRYVKNSLYNFLGAAQYWSPLVQTGKIENRSYEEWVEGIDWKREHRRSTEVDR